MRLGVYADLVYRRDGETLSTDRAFIHFVTGLQTRLDELVLFGRLDPQPGRSPYELPAELVRFVPLPHYPNVAAVGRLGRSLHGACAAFAAELERLDAVWLFGPHPVSFAFAAIARRHRTPVFLGVRQDFPEYIRNRLPSGRWRWAIPIALGLEHAFRLLARRVPTVVVGEYVARNYRRGGARVLATGFSLIRADELVTLSDALAKPWGDELRLLTVGRLEPEKNPLLLPEILAGLRADDRRWRLDVVGQGRLEADLIRRAEEIGVADAIRLLGYVANGPELWQHYRRSHAFLHVSLTEGLPQVLFEAQAAGIPIVATRVGGVGAALADGAGGLLVPPADAGAAIGALERLSKDAELRARLIGAGLENASRETIDAQLDRLAAFLHDDLARRRGLTRS